MAMADRPLRIVVIYENPTDHPGKFVAREQWAGAGAILVGGAPLIVADSLTEARSVVPDGMIRLPRNPEDEPQIVECWL